MDNKSKKGQIEDIFLRFSHIGEQIFDQLDDENLVKCREVSRPWQNLIDSAKAPEILIGFSTDQKDFEIEIDTKFQRIPQISEKIKSCLWKENIPASLAKLQKDVIEEAEVIEESILGFSIQEKLLEKLEEIFDEEKNDVQNFLTCRKMTRLWQSLMEEIKKVPCLWEDCDQVLSLKQLLQVRLLKSEHVCLFFLRKKNPPCLPF